MKSYYLLAVTDLGIALFPVIASGIRLNTLDRPSRVFFILLLTSFLTECTGFYMAGIVPNNLPVYNIANLVQIFLIALYFNYCIKMFRRRNIGIYVGVASVCAGILNLIYLQPLNSYNSYFFLFQAFIVFGMGSVLLFELMLEEVDTRIHYSPHFWIVIVLVSFYGLNFLNMSMYNYLTMHLKSDKPLIDTSIMLFNYFINLSFGLVFLFYPKMKLADV